VLWDFSIEMSRAVIVTPVYLSVAWVLMMTYQLFTETAVKTVMREILIIWPQIGYWLYGWIDIMVFVIAFSWVFVLSSVIPSLILGEESGTLVQFLVVLVLTSSVFIMQDVFVIYTGIDVEKIFGLALFLRNPLDAIFYLFFPYILMLLVDMRRRAKRENSTHTFMETSA